MPILTQQRVRISKVGVLNGYEMSSVCSYDVVKRVERGDV